MTTRLTMLRKLLFDQVFKATCPHWTETVGDKTNTNHRSRFCKGLGIGLGAAASTAYCERPGAIAFVLSNGKAPKKNYYQIIFLLKDEISN